MPQKKATADPLLEKLDAVHATLKVLVIIACARSGVTMSEARAITGMQNNQVSRIWKHVKRAE